MEKSMSDDEHKIKFAGGVLDQTSLPVLVAGARRMRRVLKAIEMIREQCGPIKVISRPRSGPLVNTEHSKHINKG